MQFVGKPTAAESVPAYDSQGLPCEHNSLAGYTSLEVMRPDSDMLNKAQRVNLRRSHEEFLDIQLIQQERPPNAMYCHAHVGLAVRYLQKLFNVLAGEKRTEVISNTIILRCKTIPRKPGAKNALLTLERHRQANKTLQCQ